MNSIIVYTTEDGKSQITLRADQQMVWLSQREMADLFAVTADNIGLQLKNLYQDGALIGEATTEEFSVVQTEGSRGQWALRIQARRACASIFTRTTLGATPLG